MDNENRSESNAMLRVLKHGLVLIEHWTNRNCWMIVRPVLLAGEKFRGCSGSWNVGMGLNESFDRRKTKVEVHSMTRRNAEAIFSKLVRKFCWS